jgi:GTP cyclohydrolase II
MITIRQQVALKVGTAQAEANIISFSGIESGAEHIAMQFVRKTASTEPTIVRLHSECLTGDVFHSSRCDCGEQLNEAINLLDKDGGVILYLRQEGRGIGLYNKLDAYALQDTGLNTYEANVKLGFGEDQRDFDEAAGLLVALGLDKIRLMTNNPYKVDSLINKGIEVTSVINTSLHIKPENTDYLKAKVAHGNHQLEIDTL